MLSFVYPLPLGGESGYGADCYSIGVRFADRPGGSTMAHPAEKNVLAVDVGNTTTRLGLFCDGALAGSFELTTPERLTADEARLGMREALGALAAPAPDGAILACVVPILSDVWARALAEVVGERPLVVGPGLKTGVRMRYDDPSEVGADRVADVVAARGSYGAPVVVVDLGTTTNIEVVDAEGAFAGGVIAPGAALGARSLSAAAARLPMIELRAPAAVIGRNTRAAMQSGVVLGEVARIDGLIDAVMGELGYEAPVVLTGDGAEAMAALLRHEVRVDDTLTLRGLWGLWKTNRRRG